MADLMKPITSIQVRPTGGPHAEVSVWVNHAFCGALVMRVEEAEEFRAALERAEGLELELAQANALLRVYIGTSERLAARAERVEEAADSAARYLLGLASGGGYATGQRHADAIVAALAAAPGARLSRPPDSFWRPVPCGHPPDPRGWQDSEGRWACHCGRYLDPAHDLLAMLDERGPLVSCGKCGCHVLLAAAPGEGGSGSLEIIRQLAYRGKEGCTSMLCTRIGLTGQCYGWHCARCHEPCSSQGHENCVTPGKEDPGKPCTCQFQGDLSGQRTPCPRHG